MTAGEHEERLCMTAGEHEEPLCMTAVCSEGERQRPANGSQRDTAWLGAHHRPISPVGELVGGARGRVGGANILVGGANRLWEGLTD